MVNLVSVLKAGSIYSPSHVNNLYSMARANITSKFRFYCFTDDNTNELSSEIEIIPLSGLFNGWWAKLEIFQLSGKFIYFDLDTIICNNIDSFIDDLFEKDKCFYGMNDVYYTGLLQSAVMYWSGNYTFLYDQFLKNSDQYINNTKYSADISKRRPYSDQDVIEFLLKSNKKKVNLIDRNQLYSFKKDLLFGKNFDRSLHRIIVFHGKPKPWEQGIIKYPYTY